MAKIVQGVAQVVVGRVGRSGQCQQGVHGVEKRGGETLKLSPLERERLLQHLAGALQRDAPVEVVRGLARKGGGVLRVSREDLPLESQFVHAHGFPFFGEIRNAEEGTAEIAVFAAEYRYRAFSRRVSVFHQNIRVPGVDVFDSLFVYPDNRAGEVIFHHAFGFGQGRIEFAQAGGQVFFPAAGKCLRGKIFGKNADQSGSYAVTRYVEQRRPAELPAVIAVKIVNVPGNRRHRLEQKSAFPTAACRGLRRVKAFLHHLRHMQVAFVHGLLLAEQPVFAADFFCAVHYFDIYDAVQKVFDGDNAEVLFAADNHNRIIERFFAAGSGKRRSLFDGLVRIDSQKFCCHHVFSPFA